MEVIGISFDGELSYLQYVNNTVYINKRIYHLASTLNNIH